MPRFLLLYGAMFAAFGVASPFLPALLLEDGLQPDGIAVLLAAGTAVRLAAGPLGGRLADRARRPSAVLCAFLCLSAVIAIGYVAADGLPLLLAVAVAHASVLAPVNPIADALTLGSARRPPGFPYGWVRGAGSAAFIVGTMLSGWLAPSAGLSVIIWLNAGLLALAAAVAVRVPDRLGGREGRCGAVERNGAWRQLFAVSGFARLMTVVALIGGSHALHDGFEVIRWQSAGLSVSQSSVLWSLSVAAEVVVFLLLGPVALRGLGPAGALAAAAVAGIVRWSAAATTANVFVMAAVEPLHGLTFALLHLACMDVIATTVPRALAATAQAFYGTVAMGVAYALVTLASGSLYRDWGAASFWAMAAMCAVALPLAASIRASVSSAAMT